MGTDLFDKQNYEVKGSLHDVTHGFVDFCQQENYDQRIDIFTFEIKKQVTFDHVIV